MVIYVSSFVELTISITMARNVDFEYRTTDNESSAEATQVLSEVVQVD